MRDVSDAAAHAQDDTLPDAAGLAAEHEQQLWQRFKGGGDASARDALIRAHLEFAKIMAAKIYALRWRDDVGFAEYLQLASLGLIDAVDRFRPELGRASFRTYAAHRIRGAILGGLGEQTEVRAQVEARQRTRCDRLASLRRSGEPPDAQAGDGDAFGRMADVAVGMALGFVLDDLRIYRSEEGVAEDNTYADAEMRKLRRVLRELLRELPAREAMLIERHYFDGEPFDAIARSLDLTKGRVSQIHRHALALLQATLRAGRHRDWAL
ncbi:MAG: sigma-70 family RNA polymerase sigma factor [Aquabacterium sp.]|nr:MAG: sigma-70 family RNA polymerase sigma factor [Aquabacterium sp.]